eukprot:TRINITY_DN4707_c0_g1_i1.p2 TRINITY_DN4707_c0_g1~~TRINITY_DN4707_c0_g1_i1.p2  ORF type:complete len:216 (+),score=68.69 TRINITY_DN4707_c0_g1_i1:84-731(+)
MEASSNINNPSFETPSSRYLAKTFGTVNIQPYQRKRKNVVLDLSKIEANEAHLIVNDLDETLVPEKRVKMNEKNEESSSKEETEENWLDDLALQAQLPLSFGSSKKRRDIEEEEKVIHEQNESIVEQSTRKVKTIKDGEYGRRRFELSKETTKTIQEIRYKLDKRNNCALDEPEEAYQPILMYANNRVGRGVTMREMEKAQKEQYEKLQRWKQWT